MVHTFFSENTMVVEKPTIKWMSRTASITLSRGANISYTEYPLGKKTIQNYSENYYLRLLKTIVTIHQC